MPTKCQISTAVPTTLPASAVISLLHDHKRHLSLDEHLTHYKRLFSSTDTSKASAKEVEPETLHQSGVGEWLASEVYQYVASLETESGSSVDGATQVTSEKQHEYVYEIWAVEIPHPFGRWMGGLTYQAAFVNLPDGIWIIVSVPGGAFGMRSWTRFSVRSRIDDAERMGELELHEDNTMDCPFGLGAFTRREIEKSHPVAHRKIMEELLKDSQRV